jgi:predicted dehydrogenase
MSNTLPLRCAVVGLGLIGRVHVNALQAAANASLVLCVDADPAAARACPSGVRFATSLDALADAQVEAVIVATPEPVHREAVEVALAAGAATLCEKPFASTLDDADAMVAAVERHGVPLFVGHAVRFDPAYRAAQAAVAEGLLGRLLSLSARRSMGVDEGRIYAGRTDPTLCLGVHDIDVMRWCAGEVTRVAAETGPALLHPDSPDVVVATLRFASGAVGLLEMCWALPAATGVEWEGALVIVGTEGSRYLEQRGGTGGDLAPELSYAFEVAGLSGGVMRMQDEHFLLAARDPDRWPGGTLGDARRAVEIALAIGQAAATGSVVELAGAR